MQQGFVDVLFGLKSKESVFECCDLANSQLTGKSYIAVSVCVVSQCRCFCFGGVTLEGVAGIFFQLDKLAFAWSTVLRSPALNCQLNSNTNK